MFDQQNAEPQLISRQSTEQLGENVVTAALKSLLGGAKQLFAKDPLSSAPKVEIPSIGEKTAIHNLSAPTNNTTPQTTTAESTSLTGTLHIHNFLPFQAVTDPDKVAFFKRYNTFTNKKQTSEQQSEGVGISAQHTTPVKK